MKNIEKYEIYKKMHEDLSKAMKNGFYYEAIFIEYAILEDRFKAVLYYANINYVDKNKKDISIKSKLNKIESRNELSSSFYKERLSSDLLNRIRAWIDNRNDLIHHLASIKYDSEKVESIAVEGNEIIKIVKNKTTSVINHLKKENK